MFVGSSQFGNAPSALGPNRWGLGSLRKIERQPIPSPDEAQPISSKASASRNRWRPHCATSMMLDIHDDMVY
jgi:hypothetical protein